MSSFSDLLKLADEKRKGVSNDSITQKPTNKKFTEIEGSLPIGTAPTPPTKLTNTTQPTPPTPQQNIAPTRDFTKVANSIVRDAVPGGLFIGKSKQIYDFLYSLTRGAVVPKRSIRVTKSTLMKGAGIGSERTLLKNLAHLKEVGLIRITEYEGQHAGNEYETLLPEEAGLMALTTPTPPTPVQSPDSHYSLQKVGTLPTVETEVGRVSLVIENKDSYTDAKTLFKDFLKIDDEMFQTIRNSFGKLDQAAKKITGKNLSKKDFEALNEIFQIIIDETEIARNRTDSVSVYLKFAEENLRRRLYPKTKSEKSPSKDRKGETKDWVNVGADSLTEESFELGEVEPLTAELRNNALQMLKGIVRDNGVEALESLQTNYTAEDFNWLKSELIKLS